MAEANENAQALKDLQRALARRDHSSSELEQKLLQKHSPEAVKQALQVAMDRRWLKSEADIAEFAVDGLERKHKSHAHIEQEMQKRGLPSPDLDFDKEQDKINQLIKRRFSKVDLNDNEECMKVVRFLRYRGFDLRAIKAVIKNVEVYLEES